MQNIRTHFPSLTRQVNGQQVIYLDGPAGTQVPNQVIEAISDYYRTSNANTHGQFIASKETDDIMDWCRQQVAIFVNAEEPSCISFGQSMTSLAFSLSRAFSRMFKPGDEAVITQLDHEANRGPWLTLEEHGITVHEIVLKPDGTLDYEDAAEKINARTRLVAAGWASNILGTVNDLSRLRKLSSEVGAYLLVDAVHYAPHFLMDVQALDCDFLLCSAYKFYGPHVGLLYCKPGLLDQLPTDRLRTVEQQAPYTIETGTLNHAAIAGVGAAIGFIGSFGSGNDLRTRLTSSFEQISAYERELALALWTGLAQIPGVTLYGPPMDTAHRAPTISFTVDGIPAIDVCRHLGRHAINAWDGHFYAIRCSEVLGLEETGGVTRMGVVAYNTMDEVERTLEVMGRLTE